MYVDHIIFVMSLRSHDPGTEAHGGYTFCGFAALVLLGKQHICDVNKLLVSRILIHNCISELLTLTNFAFFQKWVAHRQMKCEGGFQGRSNKLVDGCYSFWQGGIFPLVQPVLLQQGQK